MAKKLKNEEVDALLEKIKRKYDQYISQYYKPISLKQQFEQRYYEALKARLNLQSFFHKEIVTISTWLELAEQKQHEKLNSNLSAKKNPASESIADKVMREHQQRIQKYPAMVIGAACSEEISRLFGALEQLEERYWNKILELLFILYPGRYSAVKNSIQSKVYDYCVKGTEGLPRRLIHYKNLLLRIPRSWKDLEREEKSILVDAAVFLHEMLVEIKKAAQYTEGSPERKQDAKDIMEAIQGLLYDFRLKDLQSFKR